MLCKDIQSFFVKLWRSSTDGVNTNLNTHTYADMRGKNKPKQMHTQTVIAGELLYQSINLYL